MSTTRQYRKLHPITVQALVDAMSDEARNRPGHELFSEELKAKAFACDRVRESWVVYCRGPLGDGSWIVEWWAQ
jgi:hypothetical protein